MDPGWVLGWLWPMYLLHQFEEHGVDLLGRRYAFLDVLCETLGRHRDAIQSDRVRLYRSLPVPAATIRAMVLISFRSRLTAEAGQDYQQLDAELEHLVRDQPGYVTHKAYAAADGERLTLVWFQDQESLRSWKMQPRHLEAQRRGRERWYQFYEMEVAEVVRTSSFKRSGTR